MNYSTRMKIAAVFSLLIHAAGFVLLQLTYTPDEYSPAVTPEPIVIDLQPDAPETTAPDPEAPQQYVDVTTPAEVMPQPTDRIAEAFSQAMDQAENQATSNSPALKPGEFDVLPKRGAAPTPPEDPTPPPSPPSPEEEKPVGEEPKTEKSEEKTATKGPALKEMESPLEDKPSEPDGAEATKPTPEAPIKIAQAQTTLPQRPDSGMSRERGGVTKQGDTNFDAIQSEIAPYLKQVRQRVEQRWNEMLYTRYSGSSPVKAVIDCAIDPEGNLVSVSVVGTNNDKLYSALCRDAVQRAGPFGPFPFEVPDIYQGKNLEIRWTFNFLSPTR